MNLSLQKTDSTRFFIIKPRHSGRLTKADLGGKTSQLEPWWLHAEKRLLPLLDVNVWRCIAVLLLRKKGQQYCRTNRQQVSHPASAGKGADMSELQCHHCMTPEEWTWLLCNASVIPANKLYCNH